MKKNKVAIGPSFATLKEWGVENITSEEARLEYLVNSGAVLHGAIGALWVLWILWVVLGKRKGVENKTKKE
jgi:hypothetical protein